MRQNHSNKINSRKIILASTSPRRRQLFEEAGFWFDVVSLPFEEKYPQDMPAYHIAEYLAKEKSKEARSMIQGDEILLTADSIVVLGDKVFGKPVDFEDAYKILATLSGKKHLVYTGICLSDLSKSICFTSKSEVFFREMTHDEINWYIREFEPFDKAGAYAVQEWIGLCKISQIHGTYSNIMGLPTDLVYEGLKNFDGAIVFPQ